MLGILSPLPPELHSMLTASQGGVKECFDASAGYGLPIEMCSNHNLSTGMAISWLVPSPDCIWVWLFSVRNPLTMVVAELALLEMSSKLDHYKLYYIGFMTKNSHTQIVNEYKADSAVFYAITGCKQGCSISRFLRDTLQRESGIPTLIIDGDSMDSSVISAEEIMTKLEGYFEALEGK